MIMSKITQIFKWLQNISNNLGNIYVMKKDSTGAYAKHINLPALGMRILFWTIVATIVLIALLSAVRIIASIIALAFLCWALYEIFMKANHSNHNY